MEEMVEELQLPFHCVPETFDGSFLLSHGFAVFLPTNDSVPARQELALKTRTPSPPSSLTPRGGGLVLAPLGLRRC